MSLPVNLLIIAAFFCASATCQAASLGPIHVAGEAGFVDLDIPITQIVEDHGLFRITARGSSDGAEVGFEVDIPSEAKLTGQKPALVPGSARLVSIGAPSDNFVTLLAQLYHLPGSGLKMVPSVAASAVALGGDLAHLLGSRTEMKFFFYDSGPEERYAEVYINIEGENRTLEFHEKDDDYRKPLILALTKSP